MQITDKTIRPIPKYILQKIRQLDDKYNSTPSGQCRFYAYLTQIKGELTKVTVAVKHYRKKWYCKQVAWHGVHSDKCLVKDIEYCGFVGFGFRVGWYDEALQNCRKWFEQGLGWADDKYYDPQAEIVNPEFVEKFPEYRYSAYTLYPGVNPLKYLRRYEQYPQLEMLMKLGFEKIAMSVTVLKRVGKDKAFCRWLLAHKYELQGSSCYIGVIMRAYKTGKALDTLQTFWEARLRLRHDNTFAPVRELFATEKELFAFFEYIAAQKTNPHAPNTNKYLSKAMRSSLDISPSAIKYSIITTRKFF